MRLKKGSCDGTERQKRWGTSIRARQSEQSDRVTEHQVDRQTTWRMMDEKGRRKAAWGGGGKGKRAKHSVDHRHDDM